MSFTPNAFYTQAGLALECGISVKQVRRHMQAGTARLDKAVVRMPGVGLRFHGQTALRFIEIMRAKHKLQEVTAS